MKQFACTALTLTIVLTACGKSASVSNVQTIAPRAAELTQQLATGYQPSIRSSALLGDYIAQHMIGEVLFRSALAGVEAQISFLSQGETERDDSFALLETLGSILQVDVADMLNRSTDRSTAFDTYISNLQNLTKRAQSQLDSIQQQLTALNKTRRTDSAAAAKTQSQLNTAIRNGDYTTASDLQQSLIDQKAAVSKDETQANELTSIKNLFRDLIDVADKRLTVMAANRAALLAGVTVVDLPGAKDLGILKKGARSGLSIFDPAGQN